MYIHTVSTLLYYVLGFQIIPCSEGRLRRRFSFQFVGFCTLYIYIYPLHYYNDDDNNKYIIYFVNRSSCCEVVHVCVFVFLTVGLLLVVVKFEWLRAEPKLVKYNIKR